MLLRAFPLQEQLIPASVFLYLKEKTLPELKGDEKLLRLQLEECLKFLSMIHHCGGGIPVSQAIDNIWHLLMLESGEYFHLCEKLPAKRYIHHESKVHQKFSQTPIPQVSVLEKKQRALSWLLSYYSNFGEFSEETLPYWPIANVLKGLSTTSTSLNHFLKSSSQLF